jgi:ribosomal protein S18 acetylase RimI-like enzyme
MVIIRKATIEDTDIVKKLSDTWNREMGYLNADESIEEIKKPILKGNTLLVIINKEIVGYVSVRIMKAKKEGYRGLKPGEEYVYIEYLYIKKEYRSGKVGSKVLDTVEDIYAKPRKIKHILLVTGGDHKKLLEFYSKHGFEINYISMQKVLKEEPKMATEEY